MNFSFFRKKNNEYTDSSFTQKNELPDDCLEKISGGESTLSNDIGTKLYIYLNNKKSSKNQNNNQNNNQNKNQNKKSK